MTFHDIISVGAAIILSLGGAGAVLLALSRWFGKIWAEKILASDRAKYERELEELKADLVKNSQKDLKGFQDKLAIYRTVVDQFAEFLHDISMLFEAGRAMQQEKFEMFNKLRMRTYGYLSMLAPQDVMDAHDGLVECLYTMIEGKIPFDWPTIREKCLLMLNAARRDLGLNPSPITYNGSR